MDSVVLISLAVGGGIVLVVALVVIVGPKLGGRPNRDAAGPTPQAESAIAEINPD